MPSLPPASAIAAAHTRHNAMVRNSKVGSFCFILAGNTSAEIEAFIEVGALAYRPNSAGTMSRVQDVTISVEESRLPPSASVDALTEAGKVQIISSGGLLFKIKSIQVHNGAWNIIGLRWPDDAD